MTLEQVDYFLSEFRKIAAAAIEEGRGVNMIIDTGSCVMSTPQEDGTNLARWFLDGSAKLRGTIEPRTREEMEKLHGNSPEV